MRREALYPGRISPLSPGPPLRHPLSLPCCMYVLSRVVRDGGIPRGVQGGYTHRGTGRLYTPWYREAIPTMVLREEGYPPWSSGKKDTHHGTRAVHTHHGTRAVHTHHGTRAVHTQGGRVLVYPGW